MGMFGGYGGYWWLDSYVMAEIVYLATRRFCRSFLNRTNDPCGRQYDQISTLSIMSTFSRLSDR